MIRLFLVVLILSGLPGLGVAESKTRFSTLVATEAWDANETPLHGILLAAYDISGLAHDARVSVIFNTDTLRLEYDGRRLSPVLHFGARLTGEYKIANLLSDYFRHGENDLSRTFYASYIQGQTWLKWNARSRTYLTLEFGVRQWLFERREATADVLLLPEDSLVLEPRIHFSWWGLADDLGWRDRHRLYPHLSGFAFGVSLALNYQLEAQPWGARNPASFAPIDPRNDPEQLQFGATQWAKAGWPFASTLRLEVEQELGWMVGEDDLTRRNIGGMMPYTVNVPGVPWAYFHADDYIAAQTTLRWSMVESIEMGPLVSVVALRDVDRVGAKEFGVLWGIGAVAEWRSGPWQVDVRGGLSPALRTVHPKQKAWSALFMVGWAAE